ncbi:hypothetical protein FNV43_RR08932 [Rhamnella rubrinervis]|uniref:Uncharacterized protein n=1 Tax=Rhamnella rubrinervis TaxID=2594499 RepID=A0A8K0MJ98_9ROSA|nr:hypothetical protein FNV43_RR08932 [Rhamnella rubrinervis]
MDFGIRIKRLGAAKPLASGILSAVPTIWVQVPNALEAISFYETVFDFKVFRSKSTPYSTELRLKGDKMHIFIDERPDLENELCLAVLDWYYAEVEATVNYAGCPLHQILSFQTTWQQRGISSAATIHCFVSRTKFDNANSNLNAWLRRVCFYGYLCTHKGRRIGTHPPQPRKAIQVAAGSNFVGDTKQVYRGHYWDVIDDYSSRDFYVDSYAKGCSGWYF